MLIEQKSLSGTILDAFCGAGGSSEGARQVGLDVRVALNHWSLAVETHNANHPDTAHDCADISQVDPRRYPTTTLAWFSPSCTNHSIARGRSRQIDATPDLFGETLPDAAAERSRLAPDEYAAAMAFPVAVDDRPYVWLGTKRERVRLAGNAVTPPAARDLLACISEAVLGHTYDRTDMDLAV